MLAGAVAIQAAVYTWQYFVVSFSLFAAVGLNIFVAIQWMTSAMAVDRQFGLLPIRLLHLAVGVCVSSRARVHTQL